MNPSPVPYDYDEIKRLEHELFKKKSVLFGFDINDTEKLIVETIREGAVLEVADDYSDFKYLIPCFGDKNRAGESIVRECFKKLFLLSNPYRIKLSQISYIENTVHSLGPVFRIDVKDNEVKWHRILKKELTSHGFKLSFEKKKNHAIAKINKWQANLDAWKRKEAEYVNEI